MDNLNSILYFFPLSEKHFLLTASLNPGHTSPDVFYVLHVLRHPNTPCHRNLSSFSLFTTLAVYTALLTDILMHCS